MSLLTKIPVRHPLSLASSLHFLVMPASLVRHWCVYQLLPASLWVSVFQRLLSSDVWSWKQEVGATTATICGPIKVCYIQLLYEINQERSPRPGTRVTAPNTAKKVHSVVISFL
jgi:hypothetical protein